MAQAIEGRVLPLSLCCWGDDRIGRIRLSGLSKVEPDVSEEALNRLPKRGSRERMLRPMFQPHFVLVSDRLPRFAERSIALMEELEKLLVLLAGAGGKQGRGRRPKCNRGRQSRFVLRRSRRVPRFCWGSQTRRSWFCSNRCHHGEDPGQQVLGRYRLLLSAAEQPSYLKRRNSWNQQTNHPEEGNRVPCHG